MKKLFILLTQYQTFGANIMRFITQFKYTHASIGLEEDMNTFYSFVNKGFIEEKITKYIKPGRQPFFCQLYEIKVSNKVYKTVKKIIQSFKDRKSKLKYSKQGIALCFCKIPYEKKDKFFCSQFVATVLERSKAVKLKKKSALYLPKDFSKIPNATCSFTGTHKTFLQYFGIPSFAC